MKIYPKKSLGQNFLIDEMVIQKIVESANLKKGDVVLEIGPGRGILTAALAPRVKKVIAVEIDKNLINFLKEKFKSSKNVEVLQGDILKMSVSDELQVKRYKIVANLPYYITSPIIRLFLETKNPPSEMILMVQKEVAERIVARPGKMSILAVSVQYYAQPELLFYVDKKSFDPVPEVDSAVIKITCLSDRQAKHKLQITKEKRERFFRMVRAGFCAKRKRLANNLANSFHLDKKEVEEKLNQLGIKPNARAQELSVEEWNKLSTLVDKA